MSRKVQFSNLFSKLLKTDTLSQFYFFLWRKKTLITQNTFIFSPQSPPPPGRKLQHLPVIARHQESPPKASRTTWPPPHPTVMKIYLLQITFMTGSFTDAPLLPLPPCPMQLSRGTSSIAQLGHRVPLHGGGSIDCFLERKRPHNAADNRNTRVISARRTFFSLLTGLACVLGPGLPVFLPVSKGDVQTREFIDPRSVTLNVLSLSFFLRSLSRRDGRSRDLPSL